jgi:hypothetical protein
VSALHTIQIGDEVEFVPNPRFPTSRLRGKVMRWRKDPRGGATGWLDIEGEDGKERSCRPGQARKL